jgi:enterochelin esterase-like enzyme
LHVLWSKQEDVSAVKFLENYNQSELDALEKTTLLKSEDSPTGYYVTFRYKDPNARRVRIFGEWMFTDAAHASRFTSLWANPEEWKNGYFVYSGGSWPIADMTLNTETGVWSYTIPLPCGTWNYCFYVGGAENTPVNDVSDAKRIWDPTNAPLLYAYEADDMLRDEQLSNIYVPYDEEKQSLSDNYPEEAPRSRDNGSASYAEVTYGDTLVASFGIYLPYGYDPERTEPYPVMVLSHGGGGTESAWFNLGAAINILDNMIAEGRVEPMVMVTPNSTDLAWNRPAIMDLIINHILPYMEENYNIALDQSKRAMGGLSMGSRVTTNMLYHNTTEFGYYCILSGGLPLEDIPEELYKKEEIRDVTIFLGAGWYDTSIIRDLSIYLSLHSWFMVAINGQHGARIWFIYLKMYYGSDFSAKTIYFINQVLKVV